MKKSDLQKILVIILVLISVSISDFFTSKEKITEPAPEVNHSSSQQNTDLYKVEKVVDGDTINVSRIGEDIKVRLIGINTPETVDPRRPVECFGKEASDYLNNLLNEKYIKLENDDTQQLYDKYGRMLAYVYLDGILINKKMIEDGYAYEYTYETPYIYQQDFIEAQRQAQENKKGLWSGICEK